MKSLYLCLFSFFLFTLVSAQEWRLEQSFPMTDIDSWDVDPMGKVIYSKKDVLIKLDSNFQVMFRQSLKGVGAIEVVDARHALKTLIFSEEQQAIAFLDNTLTFHQSVHDLSGSNVSYSTNASYSAQSNRYWVYDADNSKLMLFDEMQPQPMVIENLSGILGELVVNDLREMENTLLVLDQSKGIYLFDYYGTLIDLIETDGAISVSLVKGFIFYLTPEALVRFDVRSRDEILFRLPDNGVIDFRIVGESIYLRTAEGIKKYLLK